MSQISNPPLTLSITTGLLTLSVHDNLTFDGVEVALNPDLFVNLTDHNGGVNVGKNSNNNSVNHSRDSSSISTLSQQQQQHAHHHSRDGSLASVIWNSSGSVVTGTPLVSNIGNSPGTPIAIQDNNRNNTLFRRDNTSIKAGDMIEIRVWEPKNNNHIHGQMHPTTNNIIDRVSSKLKTHVKQSSSLSSFQGVFHPLAETMKSIPQNNRPPMPPRNISNASATASPIKVESTPTVSPKNYQQQYLSPSPYLLPKRTNEQNDSITNNNNNNNDDKLQTGIPFAPTVFNDGSSTPDLKVSPNMSTLHVSNSFDNQESPRIHQSQEVLELISNTHTLKTKFVMSVTEKSLNTLKATGRTQISLLKQGK